jgi:transcriptional regulator with XRE-family HTH domain
MSQQRNDKNVEQTTLSYRLKLARTESGLNMRELARAAGVDVGYISRIESGKNDNLGSEKAHLLAAALRVSVEWLLLGVGDMQQVNDATIDSPPKNKDELIADLRADILWFKDQVVDARQKEVKLLQIIETLSTVIAGPRPKEEGRAITDATVAAPVSGVRSGARSAKSA